MREPYEPLTPPLIRFRNRKQAEADRATGEIVTKLAPIVHRWLEDDAAHAHTFDEVYQGVSERWEGLTEDDVRQAIDLLVQDGQVMLPTAPANTTPPPVWVRLSSATAGRN